jgi:hypothetical protein
MNTGIQQFLYADTNHEFPLLKSGIPIPNAGHPAENGIDFSAVVATCANRRQEFKAVIFRSFPLRKELVNIQIGVFAASSIFEVSVGCGLQHFHIVLFLGHECRGFWA